MSSKPVTKFSTSAVGELIIFAKSCPCPQVLDLRFFLSFKAGIFMLSNWQGEGNKKY